MNGVEVQAEGKKLLFVHDHKFRYIDGKFYSTGGLSDAALARYTDIFGHVTVFARVINEKNSKTTFSEITNKQVNIINGLNVSLKEFESQVRKADYIISRMPSFYGLKVIKLAKKLKKPYLIEMVGCPWDALWNHSVRGKLIAPYMTIITRREVKQAPFVLYVTNKFLQNRYPTKGKVVNCSNVALTEFDEKVIERRLLKIKNIQKKDKIILGTTAAVDVRYKGQQYVIEALGKLNKKGITNFEYQLVGSGEQTYLKSIADKYKVTDQVKFLGSMPHNKVFEWLESIDIYVQPSRQEGLPRALIEAMSMGVPAFGAKTAGIPELLEHKYIFSNSRSNIEEICSIITDFDRNKMKEQAERNYIESKKYDKNIIEIRRNNFFKEFISTCKNLKTIN